MVKCSNLFSSVSRDSYAFNSQNIPHVTVSVKQSVLFHELHIAWCLYLPGAFSEQDNYNRLQNELCVRLGEQLHLLCYNESECIKYVILNFNLHT